MSQCHVLSSVDLDHAYTHAHMYTHTHTHTHVSGFARYNVANDEIQLQHNTLLRYTTRVRAPKEPLPGVTGNGPVHNIAPLYESVEEDHADDALPYEEPTGTLTIMSQV